jgi:hypothetical protein
MICTPAAPPDVEAHGVLIKGFTATETVMLFTGILNTDAATSNCVFNGVTFVEELLAFTGKLVVMYSVPLMFKPFKTSVLGKFLVL